MCIKSMGTRKVSLLVVGTHSLMCYIVIYINEVSTNAGYLSRDVAVITLQQQKQTKTIDNNNNNTSPKDNNSHMKYYRI